MTPKQKKQRFNALSEMGCVLCGRPAQIHHCKGHEFGSGMGLKSKDEMTIPLCDYHHIGAGGFHNVGKETWEQANGTQRDWLDYVNRKLKQRGLLVA